MSDGGFPNSGKRWSEEEENKLRRLYPDNKATNLQEEFGRTAEAIKKRARRLDIKKSDKFWESHKYDDTCTTTGKSAERMFEEYADEQGWEWFRNDEIRKWKQNVRNARYEVKKWSEYEHNPDAPIWSPEEIEKRQSEAKEELNNLLDKPQPFIDLANQVSTLLEKREDRWTRFPDYVVVDNESEILFVEVKYGTSNLSSGQHSFFGFLKENKIPIYIFRVSYDGNKKLYEWYGGWK